ncbi:MAG: hypothetical protein LBC80_02840 [Treponema sp.]|jgi:hypothetical protein|nr:hypothetical protein [Treponema sp.]
MHKIGGILLILLLGFPVILAAQQDDDPSGPAIETDWDDFDYDLYVRGDQTFIISLGTIFPTLFINNGNIINPHNIRSVGGSGSLVYNYYFSPKFFIGGELTGMFIHTLRRYTLFVVPLGMRAGTQFIYGRFEFPLALSFGMCWQTYLDNGYYGIYMKANASAYFRITSQWSFGLNSSLGWFPQWTDKKTQRVDGSFANLQLAARYHF